MFKAPLLVVALCITVRAKFFIPQDPKPEGPIVNLFQWNYYDIARECEFLKLRRYGGVQVSPVTENIEVPGHPWTEKYEPISYKINSHAGDKNAFKYMINECSEHDINIYVEVVLNHMTKTYPAGTLGYNGTEADTAAFSYPGVPYSKKHFHQSCTIKDENNLDEVLKCELEGRHDLDQSNEEVRQKIATFLNTLISYGVAGFYINAAGYMSNDDLQLIYQELHYLDRDINFKYYALPFIYHEVIEKGATKATSYTRQLDTEINRYYTSPYPYVTDFKYGLDLQKYLTGEAKLKDLRSFKSAVEKKYAIVFIDNHLTQRGLGLKGSYLTAKSLKEYRLATAFMLTLSYGTPVIMSGYSFNSPEQGPPEKLVDSTGPAACKNGWTCEHRDKMISKLVRAADLGKYSKIDKWWDNGGNQIAFRKGRAFFVFNLDNTDIINQPFDTGLPAGHYCDAFKGEPSSDASTLGTCTGTEIYVYNNHTAFITLKANDPDGAVLIYDDSESQIPFGLVMEKMKRQWRLEAPNTDDSSS